MAHDERAIRLWADHLAFSMIHRGQRAAASSGPHAQWLSDPSGI